MSTTTCSMRSKGEGTAACSQTWSGSVEVKRDIFREKRQVPAQVHNGWLGRFYSEGWPAKQAKNAKTNAQTKNGWRPSGVISWCRMLFCESSGAIYFTFFARLAGTRQRLALSRGRFRGGDFGESWRAVETQLVGGGDDQRSIIRSKTYRPDTLGLLE